MFHYAIVSAHIVMLLLSYVTTITFSFSFVYHPSRLTPSSQLRTTFSSNAVAIVKQTRYSRRSSSYSSGIRQSNLQFHTSSCTNSVILHGVSVASGIVTVNDSSLSNNQTNTIALDFCDHYSQMHTDLHGVLESIDSSSLSPLDFNSSTEHNMNVIDISVHDGHRQQKHMKNSTFFTNVPKVTTMPLPVSPLATIRLTFGPKAVKAVKAIVNTAIETFQPSSGSVAVGDEISHVANTRTAIDYNDAIKKAFNAILLLSSFVVVTYAIFNIDATITRGWTQSEIAMRLPVDTWSSYEASLQENPIYTKTLINVIIYLLGDWLSQTLFQQKSILDFDASRTIRNGFIGLCFGPLVHEYYQFSDHILPVEGGMINRLQKIIMDQTIYLSVKCSIYIVAVGLLQGDSWDTSIANVKNKIVPICFTAWKFWPLVHLITYNVIPARHRILWVNCVDLVWNAILASKAAATTIDDEDDDKDQTSSLTTTLHDQSAKSITTHKVEPIPVPSTGAILSNDDSRDDIIADDSHTSYSNVLEDTPPTQPAIGSFRR